ncbi:MAG TPA: ribulose-phosphate 3-epimerase [Bacteroidales bacterium]|nr:ribulose-phosphate 3-epimerase [Bacteroidales bacterium]
MAIIAPSLLSADFLNLERDVVMLNRSEAEWFHLDIMDGVFVPNISFGFSIIRQIRGITDRTLDVHLMITDPDRYLERFRQAGADIISVHAEACRDAAWSLQTIRQLGARAGIVINPETPVSRIEPLLPLADLVLIMSVHPGFGGQSFIESSLQKIAELREIRNARGMRTLIEVDGGITTANAPAIVSAGADVLVAGNTIFASSDPVATIQTLRQAV